MCFMCSKSFTCGGYLAYLDRVERLRRRHFLRPFDYHLVVDAQERLSPSLGSYSELWHIFEAVQWLLGFRDKAGVS